jgi:hypothetical protein
MNPNPSLDCISFPHDSKGFNSLEEAMVPFMKRLAEFDSKEIEDRANDQFRQAGTIAWTPEEYKTSEHGKANAHVGLYEIHRHELSIKQPMWWTDSPQTSPARPLAGLKIIDLTRIIAGPTVGRECAELGASVMRITAPHIADFSGMHADTNWGKWNAHLDLREEKDRQTLTRLIEDSDVVIDGYRPGVMEKHGFGREDILKLAERRNRGIIYVRENSYVSQNALFSFESRFET